MVAVSVSKSDVSAVIALVLVIISALAVSKGRLFDDVPADSGVEAVCCAVSVTENPHPAANKQIVRIITNSRFTR
jgi:hypothetical protein